MTYFGALTLTQWVKSVSVSVTLLLGITFASFWQAFAAPERLVGEIRSPPAILRKYMPQGASAVLICVGRSLNGPSAEWVPKNEQILGAFTNGFDKPEIKFEFNLPIAPQCQSVDLDNNGRQDTGVMVFKAVGSIRLFGDDYLEQLEQDTGIGSINYDPKARTMSSGMLLIFSPDANQRISSGFGSDKRLFTKDDPTVALPSGYSLMRISKEGKIDFDQSAVLRIEIDPQEEAKNPDFSNQTILESFNSLIDLLKERYAYTDLRKIDWDKKRVQYLDRVKEADRTNDLAEYYSLLYDFAARIMDGHVQVISYDPKIVSKRRDNFVKEVEGDLGFRMIRYTDGRFMIYSVSDDSSAKKAGISTGSEIIRINGMDPMSHLDSRPRMGFFGSEGRATQVALVFGARFRLGTSVTVEYKRAGENEVRYTNLVATKVAEPKDLPSMPPLANRQTPFEIREIGEDGKYGYVRWPNFSNIPYFMAGFETFLSMSYGKPGIVIDMRGNTGGLMGMFYTMASFMFTREKPATMDWLDMYAYNDVTHRFEKESDESLKKLWSPIPEIAFKGEVVVLVDGESASSGEFFPQFLQKSGRATVISDAYTDGAGGSLRMALLPGKMSFTYTGGQSFYAGTREVNLEGKGVTPDIRVPINDEYVNRRMSGEDVVLKAAVDYLDGRSRPANGAAASGKPLP
ncbi:MAG: hypothetical protein K1X36_03380 [Pyrinomonadaceae bacterium]|nr:hypothetical protein [Pyrinomonadaceae bacterium]